MPENNIHPLHALSPLDGRYRTAVSELAEYLSEYALMRNRVYVECRYVIALGEQKIISLSKEEIQLLSDWVGSFSIKDAESIKSFEKTTNHDVKAVEYWLREKAQGTSLESKTHWFHFALTSEDVNSLAYGLMLRDTFANVVYPMLWNIWEKLHLLSNEHASTPMLSRTHGQPASPTTFGKEMRVFAERLSRQMKQLQPLEIPVKFGGATGTFAAHHQAFPNVDWEKFADTFVDTFTAPDMKTRLVRVFATTQTEPHDRYAECFDTVKRINTICIDFSQDMWRYISDGWIVQKRVKDEVGSSTMPHKVNPIDFENAEGNLGLANTLFEYFSRKLPISRLQRDLSDSTVERAFGEAFGHAVIGYTALLRGIDKIAVDEKNMEEALRHHPEVITEAIQTILRREGVENAYELLKNLSRGEAITLDSLHTFIETLPVSKQVQKELKTITPQNYIGYAEQIAKDDTNY